MLMQGHQARRDHRLDDARRIFTEAVEAARLSKDRPWLAQAYTELGRIERDLREIDAALLHYGEAAAIYRRLEESLRLAHTVYRAHPETPPLDLANAIRGYALLQEEIGEKQEALALWREARELYAAVNVRAGVDEGDRRIARLSRVA